MNQKIECIRSFFCDFPEALIVVIPMVMFLIGALTADIGFYVFGWDMAEVFCYAIGVLLVLFGIVCIVHLRQIGNRNIVRRKGVLR